MDEGRNFGEVNAGLRPKVDLIKVNVTKDLLIWLISQNGLHNEKNLMRVFSTKTDGLCLILTACRCLFGIPQDEMRVFLFRPAAFLVVN
jgi:hypothetical protein